jgi:hypothetical protein
MSESFAITSIDDFNTKLLNIWKDYKEKKKIEGLLFPTLYPSFITPENCQLLIVGLNPSYSAKGWREVFLKIDNRAFTKKLMGASLLVENYKLNNKKSNKKELAKLDEEIKKITDQYFTFSASENDIQSFKEEDPKLEEQAFIHHQYFDEMHKIANLLIEGYKKHPPSGFCHIDMFKYRLTEQEHLKVLRKSSPEFFSDQANLTKDLVRWLRPKLILVANATATQVFLDLFKDELTSGENFKYEDNKKKFFDQNHRGIYQLTLTEEIDTNVIFSGTLKGTGAMDLGSLQRLKYQMNEVFKINR